LRTSEEGEGTAMADDNALLATANTIKATVEAIKAVADLLSSDRTVVLEVNNVSNATLHLGPTTHKHGGFSPPPDITIPPMTTKVFGSQSSGVLIGTEGSATYNIDGVNSFTISWDNPFSGSNSCDDIVEGASKNRYVSFSISGNGNHAQMRFMIGNRPTPYSVREILGTETGTDLTQGLRRLIPPNQVPPNRVVSLRHWMGV
jgi:hypothetical protein